MTQGSRRFASFAVFGCFLALGGPAVSGDLLPTPQGDILLSVTGNIQQTNTPDSAQFDLEMLADLGETQFSTSTIWTDGIVSFAGVPLSALLDRLGITSGTLRATAVNDYTIEIPVSDIETDTPIIAYHLNGAPMPLREKGPLWIVYPYDQDDKYQSEIVYARSIWQLDRIEALN